MKRKLDARVVASIKPPTTGRLEIWDTLSPCGLRVSPKGGRSWVVALRRPGARHPARVKLGEPPEMSLADARKVAKEAAAHTDAFFAKRERPQVERVDTVATVAEDFIKRHVLANRRQRSANEAAAQLRREFVDHHRDRSINEIGRRDVLEALDRVTDRGHAIAANRLLANLRKFLGWCVDRGIIDASPVTGIKRPAKERSRDRILDSRELAAIWHCCDSMGWPFGPFERMPRVTNGFVFAANRAKSTRPLSGSSKFKLRLDGLIAEQRAEQRLGRKLSKSELPERGDYLAPWRLHDLRRTAASDMARLGHPPHVVAAILNHSPGSVMGISAVYVRHRYTDEKRAAADSWGVKSSALSAGRSEARVMPCRGA